MKKFLLSTGNSTDKVEDYIIDLFKLNIQIYPDDIPGLSRLGFNFILTDTQKVDLERTVRSKVIELIERISERFSSGIAMELVSCTLVNDQLAKVVISVNNVTSEEIKLNIYE